MKVCGGLGERLAIAATIAAESTPPERNAPYGTSDIIWRSTAAPKRSASSPVELLPAQSGRRRGGGRAVARHARRPVVGRDEDRGRRQLRDALEQRSRRRHEAAGEVVVERHAVYARLDEAGREQRADLRGDGQPPAVAVPVDGLDAERVARHEQAPLGARPRSRSRRSRSVGGRSPRHAPRRGGRSPRSPNAWRSGGRAPRARRAAPRGCRSRRWRPRRSRRPRSAAAGRRRRRRRSPAAGGRASSTRTRRPPRRRGRGGSSRPPSAARRRAGPSRRGRGGRRCRTCGHLRSGVAVLGPGLWGGVARGSCLLECTARKLAS